MNINKINTELKGSLSRKGSDMAAITDSKTRKLLAWAILIAGTLLGVAKIITAVAPNGLM